MLEKLENRIRHLQVFSTKTADELLAGEYHSVFKGHGLEFSELREYQYGDEPRSINWQITARTGHPFVKRYIEERELTIFFLVDLSASGSFGSCHRSKSDAITEFCALLAFSAIKNSDKVGLIIFTDEIERVITPGRGKRHVMRIINELLTFKPQSPRTDINKALDFFGHLHTRRSIAFLVSDFQDQNYENAMSVIAKQHDLIAVPVSDPAEHELPDIGLATLYDPERNASVLIDTSSRKVRKRFAVDAARRRESLSEKFSRLSIDEIAINTEDDIPLKLINFFKTREKRGRHG